MKKEISLYSLFLFIVPIVTLIICHQMHESYTNIKTIPFIDGKISISLVGRQDYTIWIFKPGFLFYMLISILFYLKISNYLITKDIKNKFKIYGFVSNFFLCAYIIALGNRDSLVYETIRRLAIILYIATMYINHLYLVKKLKFLRSYKKIQFNIIYLRIFYIIIFLMTILIIIGLPWVNPLFNYPDQLKNIIEWNYFFLVVIFYIPLSIMFLNIKEKN